MVSALDQPIPSGGTPGLGVAAEEPMACVFALIYEDFAWVPVISTSSLFTIPQKDGAPFQIIDPMPHYVVLRKHQNLIHEIKDPKWH
jgi:hypothetical protein